MPCNFVSSSLQLLSISIMWSSALSLTNLSQLGLCCAWLATVRHDLSCSASDLAHLRTLRRCGTPPALKIWKRKQSESNKKLSLKKYNIHSRLTNWKSIYEKKIQRNEPRFIIQARNKENEHKSESLEQEIKDLEGKWSTVTFSPQNRRAIQQQTKTYG